MKINKVGIECLEVLVELVRLKKIKDTHGKTKEYLEAQPIVWEKANIVAIKYGYIIGVDTNFEKINT